MRPVGNLSDYFNGLLSDDFNGLLSDDYNGLPGRAMPIRTFLFDLGNVVVYFSHERMYRQIAGVIGVDAERVERLLWDTGLQGDFERGRASDEEFCARLEAAVGRPLDRAAVERATADIFWPNPSIRPVLDSLRSRGYRLVLLSNTSPPHIRHVERTFDVLGVFDERVLSYAVGAAKPEPAIFEAALERIECDPRECFYADDIAAYVAAGRDFGLIGHQYTSTPRLVDELAHLGVGALPCS